MSLNFIDFDEWVYDWITLFVNKPVIWFNQDGVKPDLPFMTMNKQSLIKLGHSYTSAPNSSGYIKIIDCCELTINFQAFGENSYGRLMEIKSITSNPISQDVLLGNGISIVNNLPIQNITQLVDNNFEERASTDLIFRFSVIYGEDESIESGIIEKTKIQATYNACCNIRTNLINIDSTI